MKKLTDGKIEIHIIKTMMKKRRFEMLSNIIDIIGDADISIFDIRFYIAIALIVFLIVYIPLSKYGKALHDGDIEKAEYIRKTMCIVCLSIMLIAALVFIIEYSLL